MQSYLLLHSHLAVPLKLRVAKVVVVAETLPLLGVVATKAVCASHCFSTDTRTNNVWVKKWKLELWESDKPLAGPIISNAAPKTVFPPHQMHCISCYTISWTNSIYKALNGIAGLWNSTSPSNAVFLFSSTACFIFGLLAFLALPLSMTFIGKLPTKAI